MFRTPFLKLKFAILVIYGPNKKKRPAARVCIFDGFLHRHTPHTPNCHRPFVILFNFALLLINQICKVENRMFFVRETMRIFFLRKAVTTTSLTQVHTQNNAADYCQIEIYLIQIKSTGLISNISIW